MDKIAQKKRYNLRDVARQAGVSVATVSRVLNSPGQVSPDTRDRVQSAITALRFRPSAAARAINSGRSRMVGALVPTLDNSTYSRVIDGLENRLSQHGLSLIVARTGDDPLAELARARQLLEAGAEGLILAGLARAPEFLELIDHFRLPVVALAFFDPDSPIPTVGYDNAMAATCAAAHLAELGHRKIAVIHGPLLSNDRTLRRWEALQGLTEKLRFEPYETELSLVGGAAATRRLLESDSEATALLCFSDMLAMGAMAEMQRAGRDVPGDMSVLGIEDLPSSTATHPPLTSVRLQVQEMGEAAAEALAHWVETGTRPDPQRIDAELIVRGSTAPPRSAQ